jgi:hypothetical protein
VSERESRVVVVNDRQRRECVTPPTGGQGRQGRALSAVRSVRVVRYLYGARRTE